MDTQQLRRLSYSNGKKPISSGDEQFLRHAMRQFGNWSMTLQKGNLRIYSEERGQNISKAARERVASGWVSPLKGVKRPPEFGQKISKTEKEQYASGARRPSYGMLGKHHTKETLEKVKKTKESKRVEIGRAISKGKTGKPCPEITRIKLRAFWKGKNKGADNPNFGKKRPEVGIKVSLANKGNRNLGGWLGKHLYPETIEKIRIFHKKRWANLTIEQKNDLFAKVMQSVSTSKRPNKCEVILGKLLDKICPNEYIYTGNGKVILNNLIPDFANANGQKKVIELYGDYWHRGEDPSRRISKYSELGYSCLVIWEHELKEDIDNISKLVRAFNDKKQ